jgi:hypothetical protein
MNRHGWRGRERVGQVVCERDPSRAGCDGRSHKLPAGTLVIPTRLSGDCFYQYQPVVKINDGCAAHGEPVCGYAMREVGRLAGPTMWRSA